MKKKYFIIVMLLIMLFTSINPESIVYANQETIVPSAIRYSESSKQAEILFNVEGVDEDKYELVTIVSDSDSEVLYDGVQDTIEEITYTVRENEDYSFTVTYIDKHTEEQEEKTTILTATVTEIKEENKTEKKEEIIEDNEETKTEGEASLATLSDSSATQVDTSTDTITFDEKTFPDETLRQWIKDTFGFQESQELTETQIEEAVEKNLYDSSTNTIRAVINNSSSSTYANIENIEGLQYFTNIQEIVLSYTQVTSISYDNLPESLVALTVSRSSNLTKVDLSGCKNLNTFSALYDTQLNNVNLPEAIQTLTLTGSGLSGDWKFNNYVSLVYLDISYTNITSVNVSECSSLETLAVMYCPNLKDLILPTSTISLKVLYIYDTGLSGEWDFSDYTSLVTLLAHNTSITGIDVSGCTSLTALNVSNNPLVYLNLLNGYGGSFQASSLNTTIAKIAAKVDDSKGIYIELEGLFTVIGIQEIKVEEIIKKMSEITVSGDSAEYDEDTNRIYGIDNGATISYTYNTDNSSKTIKPQIMVTTIDINELLPNVEGVDTDFGVSTPIGTEDNLRQYGTAKKYDDSTFYSLSEIESQGMKIINGQYYYFDYSNSQNWIVIQLEDLLNFTYGIGIYAYEYTVQDNRDSKLTSIGVSRFFVGGEASNIVRSDDKSYVLIYSIDSFTIKETEIAAKYYNQSLFKEYIESQFSCQGYQDNGGLDIEKASIQYDYSTFNLISTPTLLIPQKYAITMTVFGSDGASKIINDFYVTIIENPYSYKEDNVSTENGVSGYLIIPRYIELKNDGTDSITTEIEVKFANYLNATDVTYDLSVDKNFVITNISDIGDKITVTTSSDDKDANESGDKLNLGNFTTANISNGKKITFTASSKSVTTESRWMGSVNFYFTRKQ